MIHNVVQKVVALLATHSIDVKQFISELLAHYDESEKKAEEARLMQEALQAEEQRKIQEALQKESQRVNDERVWRDFFGFAYEKDFEAWKRADPKAYESYLPQLEEFLNPPQKVEIVQESVQPTIPEEEIEVVQDTSELSKLTKEELVKMIQQYDQSYNPSLTNTRKDDMIEYYNALKEEGEKSALGNLTDTE